MGRLAPPKVGARVSLCVPVPLAGLARLAQHLSTNALWARITAIVGSTCTFTGPETYSCSCNVGTYSGTGVTCTAINNCTTGTNNCAVGSSTCTSTGPGTFSCACATGYNGTGTVCADINECLGVNNCAAVGSTCTNTIGSYTCACSSGYNGNGVTCTDLNECQGQGTGNNCSIYATCTNTPGSFNCSCKTGFTGNGVNCTGKIDSFFLFPCSFHPPKNIPFSLTSKFADINECAANATICLSNSACTNTVGSYVCVCNNGVTQANCIGTSYCSNSTYNVCAVGTGTCTNTGTGVNCTCNTGYQGNGINCTGHLLFFSALNLLISNSHYFSLPYFRLQRVCSTVRRIHMLCTFIMCQHHWVISLQLQHWVSEVWSKLHWYFLSFRLSLCAPFASSNCFPFLFCFY